MRAPSARILMYPHNARAFTSTLIGHLYELAQQHRVVLLAEPLPPQYLDLLARKDLFPGLEHLEIISGLGFTSRDLILNNRRWLRLAERAIVSYSPDLVVTENDVSSLFDMYLLRAAKQRGIRRLTIQGMGQVVDVDNLRFVELLHVYRGGVAPHWLEGLRRLARCRVRKLAGDILVHYLLPWTAGQPALRGRSSYVKFAGAPGMRDSQMHLVQSDAQHDVFLRCGVQSDRLAVLDHPLTRVPRHVFFPGQSGAPITSSGRKRFLVLMSACSFGFSRGTGKLITTEQRRALRLSIVAEIQRVLPDWQVVVKAHPDFGSLDDARTYFGPATGNIVVADPRESVEPLLPAVDAVLDLPGPWTSTLVTAASAFPGMPVIAADLDCDYISDVYLNWPGIVYVSTMTSLTSMLERISAGTYVKDENAPGPAATVRRFRTTTEAASALLNESG